MIAGRFRRWFDDTDENVRWTILPMQTGIFVVPVPTTGPSLGPIAGGIGQGEPQDFHYRRDVESSRVSKELGNPKQDISPAPIPSFDQSRMFLLACPSTSAPWDDSSTGERQCSKVERGNPVVCNSGLQKPPPQARPHSRFVKPARTWQAKFLGGPA